MKRSTTNEPNPTALPSSSSREQGNIWCEALFAQAAPASGDTARFARALLRQLPPTAPERLTAGLIAVAYLRGVA